MLVNPIWVEQYIKDELGLTGRDLCKLYGVEQDALHAYLASLGANTNEVFQRVLADIDAVRTGYRQVRVSDAHIAQLQTLLNNYPFHPLVSLLTWDGRQAWRLSGDDAQYVAFRAADIVGLNFESGDVLRQRLNTLVIWQAETLPTFGEAFRARLADITLYLIELSGVL
ncbi:MAG: hypothetical protein CUN51_03030 [Candidatus Thermofonsia Clade 1 bacterium]|uniref:Uncharacterized protein n=1 Tax=Candidatus Thermofonsia Clade 1 bacterium TaxID=2364210 RepID=A0A2M8P303_9CHLR|nr:MAG: hypothetical protein CUN51_03030 [Candidatus Thermofonsia Clade 1 bacterium]